MKFPIAHQLIRRNGRPADVMFHLISSNDR